MSDVTRIGQCLSLETSFGCCAECRHAFGHEELEEYTPPRARKSILLCAACRAAQPAKEQREEEKAKLHEQLQKFVAKAAKKQIRLDAATTVDLNLAFMAELGGPEQLAKKCMSRLKALLEKPKASEKAIQDYFRMIIHLVDASAAYQKQQGDVSQMSDEELAQEFDDLIQQGVSEKMRQLVERVSPEDFARMKEMLAGEADAA